MKSTSGADGGDVLIGPDVLEDEDLLRVHLDTLERRRCRERIARIDGTLPAAALQAGLKDV